MAGVGDPAVDNVDDVLLVQLILADSSAGWAEAWDRYGHRLHSFCLRMLDDPSEADDAVADVFLVAAQRIEQLRQPEAFRAWLYAIARRRVQRRWRDRARTAPVDPHGEVVMNVITQDLEPASSGDAAELLAAASAGLNDRDRELLALTLSAGLDTTEVARITGETVNAVSVKVTRLKDTVGRAAGALLVARHHRRDCDVLDEILARWDGTFDTVWRKRIARHVEACDDCDEKRKAATAVFAAPLLFAPPAASLRDRVLEGIATDPASIPPAGDQAESAPDLGPWDHDGFPSVTGNRRWLAYALAVAAGVLVIALAAAIVLPGDSGTDDTVLTAVGGGATTESTEDSAPSTAEPDNEPGPTIVPINSEGSEESDDDPDLATPADPPAAAPATDPVVIFEPDPATTLPVGPQVRIQLSPNGVATSTGELVTVTLNIQAPAGGASTLLSWDGPDAGSVTVAGDGTLTRSIGPFTAAPVGSAGSGTVTVTATTTDVHGRSQTSSAPLTVNVIPG